MRPRRGIMRPEPQRLRRGWPPLRTKMQPIMNSAPTRASDTYVAYGLRILSEIPVSFQLAPPDGRIPDVTIRIGDTPRALDAPQVHRGPWQAAPGIFLFNMAGIACYLVREGREIVVEPLGGSAADITTFLLGSVLAACLQQRGIFTLHASAIETEAGAVLFAGDSGAGKSTLAATFVAHGYRMLADDVLGIEVEGGLPVAVAAFPALRLWEAAVEKLKWQARPSARVRSGLDKYVVPVERFCASPLPVFAVFALRTNNRDAIEINALPSGTAFEILFKHTYRKRYVGAMGHERERFDSITALLRHSSVYRISRPMWPFRPDAVADAIKRHLRDGLPG